MTARQTLFRRVFESMMEGRSQTAQRHIDRYLKARRALEAKRRA